MVFILSIQVEAKVVEVVVCVGGGVISSQKFSKSQKNVVLCKDARKKNREAVSKSHINPLYTGKRPLSFEGCQVYFVAFIVLLKENC